MNETASGFVGFVDTGERFERGRALAQIANYVNGRVFSAFESAGDDFLDRVMKLISSTECAYAGNPHVNIAEEIRLNLLKAYTNIGRIRK